MHTTLSSIGIPTSKYVHACRNYCACCINTTSQQQQLVSTLRGQVRNGCFESVSKVLVTYYLAAGPTVSDHLLSAACRISTSQYAYYYRLCIYQLVEYIYILYERSMHNIIHNIVCIYYQSRSGGERAGARTPYEPILKNIRESNNNYYLFNFYILQQYDMGSYIMMYAYAYEPVGHICFCDTYRATPF